jgi:tripartite-type tricarboxylate transporter receptor subunit TctC
MPISRRTLIATLGALPAAALLPRQAFAAYPDRPIHLIVPFAPGGNADIVGRIVGERISNALGQPVVVDNRGGAGGSIGAEAVAHATPDGYTLFVGSNGPLTVNPFVQAHLPYDPLKDFAPVALTSYVPHCIILNNKVEELSTALPLHKAGKARIVAVASAQRSKLAPDIATFIEGGVKDFIAQSYIGILAPAKTPPAIVAQLQKAVAAGLTAGPAPDKLRAMGAEIATPEQMTSAGFAAFIKADYEHMREAAKLAGIVPK